MKIPIRPPKYSELTSAGSPSPAPTVVDNRAVLSVGFEVGVMLCRAVGIAAVGVGVGGCPRS